jgi:anthranilate synthase component 1
VVEGELREELDAIHAYLASMNMGTLVGAPKIEAARLLRRYEADKRGPYGGAVGYFTSAGDSDMAIVIRAGLVTDGTAHIRAGAGVVFDSDPRAEAEETRGKAGAVLSARRGGDDDCHVPNRAALGALHRQLRFLCFQLGRRVPET